MKVGKEKAWEETYRERNYAWIEDWVGHSNNGV